MRMIVGKYGVTINIAAEDNNFRLVVIFARACHSVRMFKMNILHEACNGVRVRALYNSLRYMSYFAFIMFLLVSVAGEELYFTDKLNCFETISLVGSLISTEVLVFIQSTIW